MNPQRAATPTTPPRLTSRERARALLDAILDVTLPTPRPATLADKLTAWLGKNHHSSPYSLKERISRRLSRDIAQLDDLLNDQVNAVLHHPVFQKLEAGWRGLRYLIDQLPEGEGPEGDKQVKVLLLNVSRKEMLDDLGNASEFDQSEIFRRVYGEHFDMPGGEPIGLLIGDYEFTNHPDDIDILAQMAEVAAAAFAPFVAAAHPSLLDLDHFAQLERPPDLSRTFAQLPYLKWNRLRDKEDVRFIGLTLPRILLREPYRDDNHRVDRFRFREDVGRPDRQDYLWGNAAFAFGAVLTRTFENTGWFADIRGVRRGKIAGGVVTGLPSSSFSTDRRGLIPRTSTEVIITDALDRQLSELGFLSLCWCQDTALSAFPNCQSIQRAKTYDRLEAKVNARISAMLQYIFCASRFGHYLKVMMRDKIGSQIEAAEMENDFNKWMMNYVNNNESAPAELKAKHPLRESKVEIIEVSGRPGHYRCNLFLRPQFQLDQLVGQITLETKMADATAT